MKKMIIIVLSIILSLTSISEVFAGYYGSGSYIATRAAEFDTTLASKFDQSDLSVAREEFIYNAQDNFNINDNPVKLLNNAGVEVLGLINYSSPNPPSPADWARYAGAAAERYDGDGINDAPNHQVVSAWEIGNEMNDKDLDGNRITGAVYKNYLQAVFTAIRSANPNAKVIAAATGGVDINWLESFYGAGGFNYCDAIGIHPYRINNISPEKNWYNIDDLTGHLLQAASFVRRHGGKHIWITEYGWNTSSSGVSQNTQANYLMRAGIIAREIPEIQKIVTYEFRDNTTSDTAEGRYGMINNNFTEKPAFNAMKTLTTHLGNESYSERIYLPNSNNGLLDDFDGGLYGWEIDGSNSDTSITASSSGSAYRGAHAFQFYYQFNTGGNDYLYYKKRIPISGSPKGLGLWVSGPNSRNTWRLRMTDATGEMFQGTIGSSTPSGWNYFHWDFANTDILAHWGGNDDGVINYPITFEGVVYDDDPDSSTDRGTAFFDDLTVNYGDADIYLYRFGNTYAAWKASGSANISFPINGTAATVYDKTGTSYPVNASGGILNLNVSESPLIIKPSSYIGKHMSQSASPVVMTPGSTANMSVTFKNTGTLNWDQGGSYPVRLALDRYQNEEFMKQFKSGWINDYRIVGTDKPTVVPGDTSVFNFTIKAPDNIAPGKYRFYVRLVAENLTWFEPDVNGGAWWEIEISKPKASWVTQSGSVTALPGDIVDMSATFKNTSGYAWSNTGTYPVRLATDRLQNEAFLKTFKDTSWISDYRISELPSVIPDGANAKIDFKLKIPNLPPGKYRFFARLVQENYSWFEPDINGGAWWEITIPSPKAEWVTQSGTVNASQGEIVPMSITFKNISGYTWQNNGSFPVRLATDRLQDETFLKTFKNISWISDYRISELPTATILNGANAKIDFFIKIPTGLAPGKYRFFVRLVQENFTWFEPDINGGAWWEINVR